MAEKYNLFTFNHKAYRTMIFDAVVAWGHMDVADEEDVKKTSNTAIECLDHFVDHGDIEEKYIITPLFARTGGSVAKWREEHKHISDGKEKLVQQIKSLMAEPDVQKRLALQLQVYRDLTHFAAHDLAHMLEEERHEMVVLHKHFSLEELQQMEATIIKSLSPQLLFHTLPLMMRSCTVTEMLPVLKGMKHGMPPHVWAKVEECCTGTATPSHWAKLAKGLA